MAVPFGYPFFLSLAFIAGIDEKNQDEHYKNSQQLALKALHRG
jgi:hypothetical protein